MSSEFTGPRVIREIAFRPNRFQESYRIDLDGVQIRLSTTQRGPDQLSIDLDLNPGDDETVVVFYGRFRSRSSGLLREPRAFSMIFDLTRGTPFVYDPAEGNLLVEFRTEPRNDQQVFFDATGQTIGDSVSRAVKWSPVSRRFDSRGLVTRFSYGRPSP